MQNNGTSKSTGLAKIWRKIIRTFEGFQLFTFKVKVPPAILFSHKVKLFGTITIFRVDVYERCRKYYFLGIWVWQLRRRYMETHIEFEEGAWYSIICGDRVVRPPLNVPRNTISKLPPGSEVRMSIDHALKVLPHVNRIALVVFNGIGDYFYTTPFIKKLREKYPKLPFVAYVSDQFDNHNSPAIAECLQFDPNIDEVFMYHGTGTSNERYWKNYDYAEVLSREPETTLILPVIYDHSPQTLSRDDALSDTFCLERSALVPLPIIYSIPALDHVKKTFEKILEMIKRRNLQGVVWFQAKSTHARIILNNGETLASKLIDAGYFVISVDPLDMDNECCLSLNLDQFRITDSIRLLQLINERIKTYCISMSSCFMSISSALDIPCLVIAAWYDSCIKTVYYPNLFVITNVPYYSVSRMQQFLASEETFEIAHNGHHEFCQYKPNYLFECFQKMVEAVENQRPKETNAIIKK